MARYNNRRNRNYPIEEEPVVEVTIPVFERQVRNDDDLIIDNRSVYEIDSECYERARRARLNARKNDYNK